MTLTDTPLLILSYNRPNHLRLLIDTLRPLAPTSLFLATDGPNPNHPYDEDKVRANRVILAQSIDWPCHIRNFHSSTNQGCRKAVSRSISWFFEHVEEGIILEDDCIPHPDFFLYSSTLLNRFRHDLRVWSISGNNFQQGRWRGDGSYYFSRYSHCWGWATWRSRWQFYDDELVHWPALRDSGLLETIFEDPRERLYWVSIFDMLYTHNKPDSWAYRWFLTCLVNSGLTTLPNQNLVKNIGFGPDATHTLGSTNPTSELRPLKNIIDPSFIIRDIHADRVTFNHVFQSNHSLVTKILAQASNLLKLAPIFRSANY
jgi:hypothetical protein